MRRPTDRALGAEEAGGTDRAPGLVAFLGAFCFMLSAVEYMVPKPLPFLRLGIANLPILIGARFLPLPSLLALALVKVIGMCLISGTLFSYVALFSLAGTLAATLAMRLALKAPSRIMSSIGASTLGAAASGVAQLLLARAFVFGEAARLVAPPFLAAGLITGILLGAFAELFVERSRWLAAIIAGEAPPLPSSTTPLEGGAAPGGPRASAALSPGRKAARSAARLARRARWESAVPAPAAAVAGAALSLVLLLAPLLAVKASLLALFLAAAWLAGKRISPLASIATSAGIVAANLIVPVGKVLASLGPIRVTEAALLDGIEKAIVFEGLLYASKAFVRRGLRLPGRLGSVLASAFDTYDGIVEYEGRIRPATLVEDADALMIEAWGGRAPTSRRH